MENENKVNRLAELANKVRKTFAYRKAKLISDFTESFSTMMVRRGVKRAELARRIGAKPTYVTRILRGSTNFTFETMVKIADALGCSIDVRLIPNERAALYQSSAIWELGRGEGHCSKALFDYGADSFVRFDAKGWQNVAVDKSKVDARAA